MNSALTLGWLGIIRLGLVQTSLGAIIVLTTSTINRVMVVELALPAMLPGFLVGLHHAVQMSRPRFGYGSDVGGRRTPWIIGGMLVLALGGAGAAMATALMGHLLWAGIALALLSFLAIGLGVGACGTTLLVMLAKHVPAERKAAAATIVWIMMIAGFAVTAGVAGHFLDPYSPLRLVEVTSVVSAGAILVTLLAVYRLEPRAGVAAATVATATPAAAPPPAFRAALAEVWEEPQARRFTLFVFISMLAYSAQDLILEPYAGTVFGMTPGQSTQLAGLQHGGVLVGMLLVAAAGRLAGGVAHLRYWTVGGCLASAVALLGIAFGGSAGREWPLAANVFALGLFNGAFAVAAIASMMTLAGHGKAQREGLRMGLWGAAQAIAFGLGGFLGTVAIDLVRGLVTDSPALAYALVFSAEAALFLVAAVLAAQVRQPDATAAGGMRAPSLGAVAVVEVMERG